jgi:hypothetical protein
MDFPKIRPLVQNSRHLQFVVDSIIAGTSAVEIWVDDTSRPTSMYIWDGSNCHYVAGRSNNPVFNKLMGDHINKTVLPISLKKKYNYFKFEYSDKYWESIIENIINIENIGKNEHIFYELSKFILLDWKKTIPDDYVVIKIDKSLIESKIEGVEGVIDEINKMWGMSENFLEKGFGFCAVHEPKDGERSIQGWCTAEYVSKGKCGIGIETYERSQKQGLATAMTAAFVENSMKHKIRPYWDTSAENMISRKVAEKSGFEEIQKYSAYSGFIQQ